MNYYYQKNKNYIFTKKIKNILINNSYHFIYTDLYSSNLSTTLFINLSNISGTFSPVFEDDVKNSIPLVYANFFPSSILTYT